VAFVLGFYDGVCLIVENVSLCMRGPFPLLLLMMMAVLAATKTAFSCPPTTNDNTRYVFDYTYTRDHCVTFTKLN